jgi:CubicO group peptidase (beta-lactamase class C family)
MKKSLFSFLFVLCFYLGSAQELYFPPVFGNTWETTSPAELNWCEDNIPPLIDFLDATNSKGFLVLKDGRIVIEEYFDTFTQDSLWYWASAGKSMTAFLVGLAQEQGFLDIENPSSDYMGTGWTSLDPAQELAITVRHQLSMTTGLDEGVADSDCTDPECLVYLDDPGNRWAYHNAPYTLLDSVIYAATGQTNNAFLFSNLTSSTGILATYLPVGYNQVLFSKPRVMARFGLLMLNEGNWNGTQIMNDMSYFNSMIQASQDINLAYGYLWWLNGSSSYMLPGLQLEIPGSAMPDAPADMYAAMGKNGQVINVVPSENLVVVRIGDAPTNEVVFVPNLYNSDIWQLLNEVINGCPNEITDVKSDERVLLFPNPGADVVRLQSASNHPIGEILITDARGVIVYAQKHPESQVSLAVLDWTPGVYFVNCVVDGAPVHLKFFRL